MKLKIKSVRNLVTGCVGLLLSFCSIFSAHGANSRSWSNYCAASITYLKKQPIVVSQFSDAKVGDLISGGYLYLPIDSLAIPVARKPIDAVRVIGKTNNGQAPLLVFYGHDNHPSFAIGMVNPRSLDTKESTSRDIAVQLQSKTAQDELPNTPLSPDFWLSLAEKYYSSGLTLVKSVEQSDISLVNCHAPTDSDWATLYSLYVKSILIPYFSGYGFRGLEKAEADGIRTWIVRYSTRTNYILTVNGREYVQITVFQVKGTPSTLTIINSKKAKSLLATSNPKWANSILRTMLYGDITTASSWEKIVGELKKSGLKVTGG
ncbi:MAG: hypothetical protein ACREGG_04500 [Candidatus Saccharimonadales bacterium]